MQQKKKECYKCEKPSFIFRNYEGHRYCRACWERLKQELSLNIQKPTVSRQPISRRSEGRAKQENAYRVLNKVYLANNLVCVANLPGMCTLEATEVHHAGGRIGDKLTDIKDFRALCHPCHVWVELHPVEAKELNLSKSRLK